MTRYKRNFKTASFGFGVVAVIPFMMVCVVTVTSFDVRRLLVNSISGDQSVVKMLSGTNKEAGKLFNQTAEFASRALWVHKGKFVFPAGTTIVLTPLITIPAFRRKPFNGGLNSDIQLSFPMYVTLDKMGFTHNMHPLPFDRPPYWPFGVLRRPIESENYPNENDNMTTTDRPGPPMITTPRRSTTPASAFDPDGALSPSEIEGVMLPPETGDVLPPPPDIGGMQPPDGPGGGDFFKGFKSGGTGTKVFTYFPLRKRPGIGRVKSRSRRSIMSLPPPESLHGSDRALILPKIEEMLGNVGFEGRGCMLRAICEIHEFPLQEGYGLFGDLISWFFSVSLSPYAKSHMPEYLKAEEAGRDGNCNEYKKVCAKSLFKWEMERKHDHDHNEL
ncbi:hypothetical protein Ocin01_15779 [Orchesella cincta]|uniref:Uncharacterized protein n=1 Tax=Orchesella cincta TaxID=48709 RepID=A0A1D2MDG4_ORCCI|nr:hypothetical protein Ocin01_15779 [Orchesella cincta]